MARNKGSKVKITGQREARPTTVGDTSRKRMETLGEKGTSPPSGGSEKQAQSWKGKCGRYGEVEAMQKMKA